MYFKDERINFCINTYLEVSEESNVLKKFLETISKDVFNAINNYQSIISSERCKKISIKFKKDWSSVYDTLVIKLQDGKEVHVFTLIYGHFCSEMINEFEGSKSFVNYEKYKVKTLFSPSQKIISKYSNLFFCNDEISVNFVEDKNGKISKYAKVFSKIKLNAKNLKSYKFYRDLDKQICR